MLPQPTQRLWQPGPQLRPPQKQHSGLAALRDAEARGAPAAGVEPDAVDHRGGERLLEGDRAEPDFLGHCVWDEKRRARAVLGGRR